MFVVIFEVRPKPAEWDRYLELAGMLRPKLEAMPGFVDNERYKLEGDQGWVLSLSTWEDEKALVRWRTHALHHEVQEKGRFEVFENYRLRVGEAIADSASDELPQTRLEVTEQGRGEAVTIAEAMPGTDPPADPVGGAGLVEAKRYAGINTGGKRLLLATWRDVEAAAGWTRAQPPGPRYRDVRVVRDYGMHERAEAPQFYPPVRPAG